MELEWIDGSRPYGMHYLVDQLSKRCFATIAEPRDGNLLYVTDIRVAGVDRSYTDLDAAKSYCEGVAIEDDMECAKAAMRGISIEDKPAVEGLVLCEECVAALQGVVSK